MDNIYIVISEEYSDYGIRAVFSTREMADKFKEMMKDHIRHIWVEVFPIDKFEDTIRKNLAPWKIWINKDGKVLRPSGDNPEYIDGFEEGIEFDKGKIRYDEDLRDGFLEVKCFARDEQHACKIAREKWAEFIALGKWEDF